MSFYSNKYDYVLKSSQDYYPFGMLMPTRTWDAESSYSFGFNGMEKDDEMKGAGNSYDFGARMYDNRLGRWWSVDAFFIKYPEISSYVYALNTPIICIDPDGDIVRIVIEDKAKRESVLSAIQSQTKDKVKFRNDGTLVYRKTISSIFSKKDMGTNLVRDMIDNEKTITLAEGKEYKTQVEDIEAASRQGENGGSNSIVNLVFEGNKLAPVPDMLTTKGGGRTFSGTRAMFHELIHASHSQKGIRGVGFIKLRTRNGELKEAVNPESRFELFTHEEYNTRKEENILFQDENMKRPLTLKPYEFKFIELKPNKVELNKIPLPKE